MTGSWTPRRALGAGLVPGAAYLVHELRYAADADASRAAVAAHGYLGGVAPLLVLGLGLALGALLVRLADAWRTGRADGCGRPCVLRLWSVATLGLLAVFGVQEAAEGLIAFGDPTAALNTPGALLALPAALAVGGAIALLVRGTEALAHRVAGLALRRRRALPSPARTVVLPAGPVVRLRPAPLARCGAGRAPPLLLRA